MNEKEKSLKLAKLMRWRVDKDGCTYLFDSGLQPVNPYDTGAYGLSQFAAILLKFPEMMLVWQRYFDPDSQEPRYILEPTQAIILDEILRMYGEGL